MTRYTTIIKEYCDGFENHEIVGNLVRACEYEIKKSDRCYVDDANNLYVVNARTHGVCVCTEDGCF